MFPFPIELKEAASGVGILETRHCISVISLGYTGRKALVVTDPFQYSYPMFCTIFTRGMKGPFDLSSTAIGVAKLSEDTDRETQAHVQGITERLDAGVGITASCWPASSSSIDSFKSKSGISTESLLPSFAGGTVVALIWLKEASSSDHAFCSIYVSTHHSWCSTNVQDINLMIYSPSCPIL